MDILNFISWIKGRRIVTSVNPTKTLVPVGLKDDRRDDEYLAGAITVADLAAQFGGGGLDIETITVDMSGTVTFYSNFATLTNYVFAGFETFEIAKSSIISLSDGSYLVGPATVAPVPA